MSALKSFAEDILLTAAERDWTIQGLGMLRTYLPGNARLHVWDPEAKVEAASTMHTHPWDMRSTVIAGAVRNLRYEETRGTGLWKCQQIRCGEGGGICGEPRVVDLNLVQDQTLHAGESYSQTYDEIHESEPQPGTVTVIERTVPEDGDPDYAYVYWAASDEWGTAEPRIATLDEIRGITQRALELYF